MPELRFKGLGHRLLAFGKELERGESAHFTEMEARTLASMRNIVMEEKAPPSGVSAKKLGKATVLLDHTPPAPASDEPEAQQGEGQPTKTESEKEN